MPGEELVDDLFSAAFDEEIGGEVEAEPEVDADSSAAQSEAEKAEAEKAAAEKAESEKVEAEKAEAARVEAEKAAASVVAPLTTEDVTKAVKDALAAKEPAAAVEEPEDPKIAEALKELEEQWPTHKVAVGALVDKALKKQREEMLAEFKAIVTPLQEQLAPVVQTVQTDAAAKHMATITAAHPDALTILPKVEEWIAKQPAYLQPAYNAVLDAGSAEQVVEFYDNYKKATGVAAAPVADPAKDAVAEKLQRMETPATVRTSVSAEPEPEDFDSAFEAELKKLKLAS